MAKPTLPADSKLASKLLDHNSALDAKRTDHGLFGLLGDAHHKPGNVAALAILLAFILIAALLFAPVDPSVDKGNLFALSGTIITGALGFLFGRASSSMQ